MSERRQNFHQTIVGANLTSSSFPLQQAIRTMTDYLREHGYSSFDAAHAATLYYYTQLEHQTKLLAFMDCFHIIGWVTLAAAPLVLLIRHVRAPGKASAAH